MARTLFEKVWDTHVITSLAAGVDLLHIDRNMLHDLGGGESLSQLARDGRSVRNPELTLATPDHIVETRQGRTGGIAPWADEVIDKLCVLAKENSIPLYNVGELEHGIVHVMAPELGFVLPGTTIVCGDSHTCTLGAFGAVAFGIGSSEVVHVLATQTLPQRRPKTMRVRFNGTLPNGIGAKDMSLALIRAIGTAGATGYAIEYVGEAVRGLDMEGRMTLCNLSIESGAKVGMIAPDETTFRWLEGRPQAPTGRAWEQAVSAWRELATDEHAKFDKDIVIDCSTLAPYITWGTSPEQVIAVDQPIPQLDEAPTSVHRTEWGNALEYMGLKGGESLIGIRVDRVFIGSCSNSRLPDLRRAAQIVAGKQVAAHVEAWVVPGSERVKRAAEAEGLDTVFKKAGLQWREPGCSLCVGANGEVVAPGQRCVSTSNRNFTGRQGPGARTHLASPEMAAAAAITGAITDVRTLK